MSSKCFTKSRLSKWAPTNVLECTVLYCTGSSLKHRSVRHAKEHAATKDHSHHDQALYCTVANDCIAWKTNHYCTVLVLYYSVKNHAQGSIGHRSHTSMRQQAVLFTGETKCWRKCKYEAMPGSTKQVTILYCGIIATYTNMLSCSLVQQLLL